MTSEKIEDIKADAKKAASDLGNIESHANIGKKIDDALK